jgi:CPA1 family monovalent cation:H+ antiporter
MFLFIPILIFESAFNMDVPLLMRNLVPSLVLAGPGLLISTGLIGGLIYVVTPLPLESALIFGCLISATDPVAVIALFREVGAPKRLNILMEGESVFNDATAIVTFQIILAVIATGILDAETITGGVVDFFLVFFGGLLVGLAFGWLVVRTIPLIGNQPLVHITFTLVTAYAAFIFADHYLHASGIMAVLSAGLTIGYYGPSLYKQQVHDYLEMFWEDAAFVANSLIFLMLGLSEKVFLTYTLSNPQGLLYPVLIAIAIVIVVRFAVVSSLVPIVNRLPGSTPINGRYRLVLGWGGLRGAVAIALAMSLPIHFPYRWQIIDFAFGVTLFTLLVNGTTMSWLVRRLQLDRPSPTDAYVGAYARLKSIRQVIARLKAYKPVLPLSDDARQRLLEPYEVEEREASDELTGLRERLADNRAKRRRLLWLQAKAVRRRTYLHRVHEGLLSRRAQQALERGLDRGIADSGEALPTAAGDLRLPSDRRVGLGLLRVAMQVLPGFAVLEHLRMRHLEAVAEEALAVIAGVNAVTTELDHLQDFAGADDEDLRQCRQHHQRIQDMVRNRLDLLQDSHANAGNLIRQRMIERIARDAREDVIQEMVSTGELSSDVARSLRERFEMGAIR